MSDQQKNFTRVIPNKDSPEELYFGEDKQRIRSLRYGDSSPVSIVKPTENSKYDDFKMNNQWTSKTNFHSQVQETTQTMDVIFGREETNPLRNYAVTISAYPNDPRFEYISKINRLNLDEARIRDFQRGKGIHIQRSQGVKKDIRDPNSIYSPLFGANFDQVSSDGSRYTCQCGNTKGQQNQDTICPFCGTKVIRKDDDLEICGWIILEHDYIIHPGLYKAIEFFMGKAQLEAIINVEDIKDENGFSIPKEKTDANPYVDYGLLGFYEHFDEIMKHFLNLNPGKIDNYNDIMRDRDKVFTHSIPVYTTLLRPYHLTNGDRFAFEETNKNFNMMANLGDILNNKPMVRSKNNKKTRNQLLYDMQYNFDQVYNEVLKIMSSKKGIIRSLYGGRYNFTCRCVIVPNWRLRTDQIRLPFKALVKLLEHSIINILHNSYGMSMSQAKTCWARAYESYDQRIWEIVNYIIDANQNGIPFLINRNPTLNYGSILQMFCIGISGEEPENHTLELPLCVLPGLNADRSS